MHLHVHNMDDMRRRDGNSLCRTLLPATSVTLLPPRFSPPPPPPPFSLQQNKRFRAIKWRRPKWIASRVRGVLIRRSWLAGAHNFLAAVCEIVRDGARGMRGRTFVVFIRFEALAIGFGDRDFVHFSSVQECVRQFLYGLAAKVGKWGEKRA